MKKVSTLALALVCALALAMPVSADVAWGPLILVAHPMPVIILAVVIVAAALLIRAVKNRKNK